MIPLQRLSYMYFKPVLKLFPSLGKREQPREIVEPSSQCESLKVGILKKSASTWCSRGL